MHKRHYISRERYWLLYNRYKDELGVFSTITEPVGSWYHPFSGNMMTEWGFPDHDTPLIGMQERWDVDELDASIRKNVLVQYWVCIPLEEDHERS